jgi:hypothetical protein
MVRSCSLACVLVASLLGVRADAAEPERPGNVRATMVQPASPMQQTIYEWRWARSAPALALTRQFAGGFGTESEVGLIRQAAYAEAWEQLAVCDALSVASPDAWVEEEVGAAPDVGWMILERDGAAPRYVPDPYGAGLPCTIAVRSPFAGVVAPPPFRNPFWEEGEFGMIQSRTDIPAWVWIDGQPTGLQTPLLEHRVAPGEHIVEWRSVDGEVLRSATIRVGVGQTTTINVELAPDTGPSEPFGPPDEWLDSTG